MREGGRKEGRKEGRKGGREKRNILYVMEYYSATRKKEILLFVTTWMDLEGSMLSETSQTEKNMCTASYHLYMKSKIKNQTHQNIE